MASASDKMKCVKCANIREVGQCTNCDHTKYEGHYGNIRCERCLKDFIWWTCDICGTENPVNRTRQKRSRCFIATAVYGNVSAPEVIFLQHFRDSKFKQSPIGRGVIRVYERYSPSLADWIIKHSATRFWIRRLILSPIV